MFHPCRKDCGKEPAVWMIPGYPNYWIVMHASLGKIMFIVAAFQASPWWGVGVLLGGLTCGIVPLIFLFTHLEESKKAFLCALSGFLLVLVVAIATPNYLRAKAAAANAQPAIAAP